MSQNFNLRDPFFNPKVRVLLWNTKASKTPNYATSDLFKTVIHGFNAPVLPLVDGADRKVYHILIHLVSLIEPFQEVGVFPF
mgnify:CR=1 FL=1